MDYRDIHQEVYEDLLEFLGREPSLKELDEAFQDRSSGMVDAIIEWDESWLK
jgi:hypothetical protein